MKKAMLLAAGRGERLKPLTDTLPKPLLSVGSQTLIERNLVRLKAAGIEEVVINVCYRARQIIDVVGDGERFGLNITFSFEPEVPLGTGGGVLQALSILGNEPFILLGADVWTDYPFEALSLSAGKLAHLVMVENPSFHPEGDYSLLPSGLLDFTVVPKYTYGSLSVIHPKLFDQGESGAFQLAPLFVRGIKKKLVTGELYHGPWFNVGTVKELKKLEQYVS